MTAWASPRWRRSCVSLKNYLALPRTFKRCKSNESHEIGDSESADIEDLEFPEIEIDGADHDEALSFAHNFDGDLAEEYGSDESHSMSGTDHPSFTKAFTKIEGDGRTHRLRKHGNQPLPLSPVIDPVSASARVKWKLKKAPPPKPEEMTPFQKRLSINPYAQILATPVRSAASSFSRLPRFFHFALDLQKSPYPPHNMTLVPSKLWAEGEPDGHKKVKTRGPQMWLDLLKVQVDLFDSRGSAIINPLKFAFGAYLARDERRQLTLRKNLSEFVLKSLRQAAMRQLAWAFKNPKSGLVVPCDGGAYDACNIQNVACVVYAGSLCGQNYEALHQEVLRWITKIYALSGRVRVSQSIMHGTPKNNNIPLAPRLSPMMNMEAFFPPNRSPLVWNAEGKAVPVYSLMDLLGAEKTDELLRGTKFEDIRCFVLVEDARNTKPHMSLMRIENYLAVDLTWKRGMHWKYEHAAADDEDLQDESE